MHNLFYMKVDFVRSDTCFPSKFIGIATRGSVTIPLQSLTHITAPRVQ